MGWEEIRGGEAVAETCRSFLDQAPDLVPHCVPIIPEDGGDLVLLRNTFTGHGFSAGDGAAGEVELVFIEVGVIRDGLWCRTELFDEADEPVARARYAELRRHLAGGLDATSAGRVLGEYLDRVQTRDTGALRSLLAEDVAVSDHRPLGSPPATGPDAALAVVASALGVTSELRYEVEQVLASSEFGVSVRGAWVGTAVEGGGAVTVPMSLVVSVRDGLVGSIDLYEHGDEPDLPSAI